MGDKYNIETDTSAYYLQNTLSEKYKMLFETIKWNLPCLRMQTGTSHG